MRLRNLFKDQEVLDAIDTHGTDYAAIASELSGLHDGVTVSRQLARYWCRQFAVTKKNGDHYLTLATANRAIKQEREVRVPKSSDQLATVEQPSDPSRILFFTDTHAPYHHTDLLWFLEEVRAKHQPTMIIHGGDEVDHHALSFHNSDPNLDAAGPELEKSIMFLTELERMFPHMRICESNHGSLHYRKAKAHGIPVQYLKTYRDILFPHGGGEGWSWHNFIRIEMEYGRDLQFQHQAAGDLTKAAAHEGANLYVGHEHGKFGIGYAANPATTYHSVYAGCTLDTDALAFAYGALFPNKPITGCVVIYDGVPQCIPMILDKHGRWTGKGI